MSEPRTNRLSIDGGQVKEDEHEHHASYKPIEEDREFRTSKPNLTKSKEKLSPDGAEEKLLQKEDEAKIVTRVDMADAKYVVGDHRNGDAKIELDANKRQYTGLTKEELLKYADDPFWVKLRWFMFILFWALWLLMLAVAITIIVRAPRCDPPKEKTWFERGPLVDVDAMSYDEVEEMLPTLQNNMVQGIFIDVPTYEAIENPDILQKFKDFVLNAKKVGVNVIVDLFPSYVSLNHKWFGLSENRTAGYEDYFIWRKGTEYDGNGTVVKPPTNWIRSHASAWKKSEIRRDEFYLCLYGAEKPHLNFDNSAVVSNFNNAVRAWIKAGASGVRLNDVRELLVDRSFPEESPAAGPGRVLGSVHTDDDFWLRSASIDRPGLGPLLAQWARVVNETGPTPTSDEMVFTLAEEGVKKEYFRSHNASELTLRPASLALRPLEANVTAFASRLNASLENWPAVQLKPLVEQDGDQLADWAMLLPATPILTPNQLNSTVNATETRLSILGALRKDASIQHGHYDILAVPNNNNTEDKLLACVRFKIGHSGYVAIYNPTEGQLFANLTGVPSVPSGPIALFTHSKLHDGKSHYDSDNIPVPGLQTRVLSYVPQTSVEK